MSDVSWRCICAWVNTYFPDVRLYYDVTCLQTDTVQSVTYLHFIRPVLYSVTSSEPVKSRSQFIELLEDFQQKLIIAPVAEEYFTVVQNILLLDLVLSRRTRPAFSLNWEMIYII